MDIEFQESFIRKMNRSIRILQGISIIIFISIYFLGLSSVLMNKQILLCALCLIAEILMFFAKRNLEQNKKEKGK